MTNRNTDTPATERTESPLIIERHSGGFRLLGLELYTPQNDETDTAPRVLTFEGYALKALGYLAYFLDKNPGRAHDLMAGAFVFEQGGRFEAVATNGSGMIFTRFNVGDGVKVGEGDTAGAAFFIPTKVLHGLKKGTVSLSILAGDTTHRNFVVKAKNGQCSDFFKALHPGRYRFSSLFRAVSNSFELRRLSDLTATLQLGDKTLEPLAKLSKATRGVVRLYPPQLEHSAAPFAFFEPTGLYHRGPVRAVGVVMPCRLPDLP